MKIKGEFALKKLADFYAIVPVGESIKKYNCMITLNESGVLLWKALERGSDLEKLKEALTREYSVDELRAEKDVLAFLEQLKKADII